MQIDQIQSMLDVVKIAEIRDQSEYRATLVKEKIQLRSIDPLKACQELEDVIGQIADTDPGILGLVLECACLIFNMVDTESSNEVQACGELVMSILQVIRPRLLFAQVLLLADTLVTIEKWLDALRKHLGAATYKVEFNRAKDEGEILDFVFRFLQLVPPRVMDQGQARAITAAYRILVQCKESPCCIRLPHLIAMQRFLSLEMQHPEARNIAECLRHYQDRYLVSVKAEPRKGIALMFGCNINFPHPTTPCPDSAKLPVAYIRYHGTVPIGGRKYRGTSVVHPYNSSFTDKQWGLSALLSFTAMLPNTLSARLVKNHTERGKERHRWKLIENGQQIGYIESKDLESFEFHLTHFISSLFEHSKSQNKTIHVLFADALKRSSPVQKEIKKYCVRFMPKTQLVQHLILARSAKKFEPQSIVQVLATCDGLKTVHVGDDGRLLSACWVASWAPSAIKKASYFSLDASFYALRPYVYCVPHVIHCNTSIPIGISVATSETAELYEQFFELLPAESAERLRQKICITDEGVAVGSFLSSHSIRQVLCHRHLIQSFGASGLLGALVRLILKSSSSESFDKRKDYAKNVILEVEKRGKKIEKLNKYWTFIGESHSEEAKLGEDKENYVWKWALWCRASVTNTTNHVESFHRTINMAVRPHGKKVGFVKALHIIIEQIKKKREQWMRFAERNLQEAFTKLEKKGRCGDNQACECSFVRELSRRWDVKERFPCAHINADLWKDMFIKFKEAVLEKIQKVEKKLVTTLNSDIIVSSSRERPQFEVKRIPIPTPERKNHQIGKRELQILTTEEKLPVKIASQIYPSFRSRLAFEVVSQICRTVTGNGEGKSVAALFVDCYDAVASRYAISRKRA